MSEEVWILGATGRVGQAVAAQLDNRGCSVVITGRDRGRLARVADDLSGAARIVSGTLVDLLAGLRQAEPAVVVNTIGPFPQTAPQVLAALPETTHYVDVANEQAAITNLLLRPSAADASRTVVTGAGYGVLGTESVVHKLCADRPPARSVRVDAIPSVSMEAGRVGVALARSILDGLADGGAKVEEDRLASTPFGAEPLDLVTPDGDNVRTAAMPSGELIAAWRGSRAASVLAASAMVPSSGAARLLLPVASNLLRAAPLRHFAASRLARVATAARPKPRAHSWGHARVTWQDGQVAEGWLRAPEGMEFTSGVLAEVAVRMLAGGTPRGVFTPAAAFGPDLAVAAGGEFVLSDVRQS